MFSKNHRLWTTHSFTSDMVRSIASHNSQNIFTRLSMRSSSSQTIKLSRRVTLNSNKLMETSQMEQICTTQIVISNTKTNKTQCTNLLAASHQYQIVPQRLLIGMDQHEDSILILGDSNRLSKPAKMATYSPS